MKQFKKLSRFTAAFLSLLTAFSIVPTATITASAQTIHKTNASLDSKEVKRNVYLDALGYLGYKEHFLHPATTQAQARGIQCLKKRQMRGKLKNLISSLPHLQTVLKLEIFSYLK